ncbi:MAG: hypothetical protein ABIO99_01220 [Candidatus Limnocylindria bacterium]
MTDDGLYQALRRADLPMGIERWRLAMMPGIERPTGPDEWSGALVVIEQGTLEVECIAGGTEQFAAGDLLALGCLPIRALRNRGDGEMRLIAVRRRVSQSPIATSTRPTGEPTP